MIESYRLANVATYDSEGQLVSGLNKINFFYGANGSGKTTTSEFLADQTNPKYVSCHINWKSEPLKTLVYNKNFRERNFNGSSDIAGVFTLGEAGIEVQEEISRKNKELEKYKENLSSRKQTREAKKDEKIKCESEFTDECWEVQKKFKDDFKQVFRGYMGSRATFRDVILAKTQLLSQPKDILHFEELLKLGQTFIGSKPEPLSCLTLPNVLFNLAAIEDDPIWELPVLGQSDIDIGQMINEMNLTDWVHYGMSHIKDDTCPFCQQKTITDEFKYKLELYFDDSFKEKTSYISSRLEEYGHILSQVESVKDYLIKASREGYQEYVNEVDIESLFLALMETMKSNLLSMSEKSEKPSNKIEISKTIATIERFKASINLVNESISFRNKIISDFEKEKKSYYDDVWRFILDDLNRPISKYLAACKSADKAIAGISAQIDKAEKEINILSNEISQLSKDVTSVAPAVIEINRMLNAYGFTNFKIVPSESNANSYSIKRDNGDLALETLSEGEVTFITFLYFIQLIKGTLSEDGVIKDKVVVIDDPISSLDSNLLYIVSAIIKDLIREVKDVSTVKQLIILTHNVYFHKEASFDNGRSNGCKYTSFWIIRKNKNVSKITCYGMTNPINSSYELLWREIKNVKESSSITIQNTMRRILENYFKILGKFDDVSIVECFESHEEKQMCRSLLYWINDGSHCMPDDLFIQTEGDDVERFMGVFKNIFNYTNHIAHYNMMMGIESAKDEEPKDDLAA